MLPSGGFSKRRVDGNFSGSSSSRLRATIGISPYQVQRKADPLQPRRSPLFQGRRGSGEMVISDSFVGADGIPAVAIDLPILAADGGIIMHLGG